MPPGPSLRRGLGGHAPSYLPNFYGNSETRAIFDG